MLLGKRVATTLELAALPGGPHDARLFKTDLRVEHRCQPFARLRGKLSQLLLENQLRFGLVGLLPGSAGAGRRLKMNDAFFVSSLRGFEGGHIGRRMPPGDTDRYPMAGRSGFRFLGDHLGADCVV